MQQSRDFNSLPLEIQQRFLIDNPNLLLQSRFLNRELRDITENERIRTFCSRPISYTEYQKYLLALPEFSMISNDSSNDKTIFRIYKFHKIANIKYLLFGVSIILESDTLNVSMLKDKGEINLTTSFIFKGKILGFDFGNTLQNFEFDLITQYAILSQRSSCKEVIKNLIWDKYNSFPTNPVIINIYLTNSLPAKYYEAISKQVLHPNDPNDMDKIVSANNLLDSIVRKILTNALK